MKKQNKKSDKQNGSALILVVVVTVLLSVIGVMFMMISRASEMETAAVIQSTDLDNAVDTVVSRINEVLVEDLFGNNGLIVDNAGGSDEPYDMSNIAIDPWLASLEPSVGLDGFGVPVYYWGRITDLFENNFGVPLVPAYFDPQDRRDDLTLINSNEWDGTKSELAVDSQGLLVKIIEPKDRTYVIQQSAADWSYQLAGARADADGDGVADSRWVQVPGLTSSRGESVFAAVRIIDNCAMLNLNGAHCFYQDSYATDLSPFTTPWYATESEMAGAIPYHGNQSGSGRYLTEINYMPFLRGHDLKGNFFEGSAGGDDWYNLMFARGMYDTVSDLPYSPKNCQAIFQQIENPIPDYHFFDIGDELELRNRYLVTSKVESRFEQNSVANYTLDSGNGAGGAYAALEVPRDTTNDFGSWKLRIDPAQFDKWDMSGTLRPNTDPMFPYFYRYDRRHVCTVYSYDRMLSGNQGPLLYSKLEADGWSKEQIAQTRQRIFWYPLLYSELFGAGWAFDDIVNAQHIFWSVGPVSTDIAVPVYNTVSGLWESNTNNTETRRRILHLLFSLREYFNQQNPGNPTGAAKRAAQVVANIIDFSDGNFDVNGDPDPTGPVGDHPRDFGPFYDAAYDQQDNIDCTFITEQIIEDMMLEVSAVILDPANSFSVPFGLNATDIVFGYERQPFISEVYVNWDATGLLEIAVELINPYDTDIDLQDWILHVGDTQVHQFLLSEIVPAYDTSTSTIGRAVVKSGATVYPGINYTMSTPSLATIQSELFGGNSVAIQLLREDPSTPGSYYVIDQVSDEKIRETNNEIMGVLGQNALKRDDTYWGYIFATYALQREVDATFTLTLGQDNLVTVPTPDSFQIGVADDGLSLTRWHELEVLGLYGNGPESSDPNLIQTVSSELANLDPSAVPHFDLANDVPNVLDYITTINRPDFGSLPGRININTAPVHVIAAAIPPTLADPNAADSDETVTFSALQLAQEIVDHRNTAGPYQRISDLLSISEFKQYIGSQTWADPDAGNVGARSIEDDIEEEHWILSNLANKFTVRSDVFTAYILVRLGETGPQRRVIGIFDRSQVWDKNDRPKRVALHPVPDPR